MSDEKKPTDARAELIRAKIAAGLRPEQAEEVVRAQEAEDAAQEAAKKRGGKPKEAEKPAGS